MRVYYLIKKFCEENAGKYSMRDDDNRLGIVVNKDFYHMDMLTELTEYMDKAEISGSELEFSEGLNVEAFGEDMIVYFPNVDVRQVKFSELMDEIEADILPTEADILSGE